MTALFLWPLFWFSQRLKNRLRVGSNPPPKKERLGGLFNKHSQPIG